MLQLLCITSSLFLSRKSLIYERPFNTNNFVLNLSLLSESTSGHFTQLLQWSIYNMFTNIPQYYSTPVNSKLCAEHFFIRSSNKHALIETVICILNNCILMNCWCATVLYILSNTVYIWNFWSDGMQYR